MTREHERLFRNIENEIDQIAEKGLSTANLETAQKLVCMYKDILNTEYWEKKKEYYDEVIDQMRDGGEASYTEDGGYSSRRRRDSMGRYSRESRGNSYNSYNDRSTRRGYSGADDRVRDYDRYIDEKHSYRSGEKSGDCKQRMLEALESHLEGIMEDVNEIGRDADCAEEKDLLRRYISKMKSAIS